MLERLRHRVPRTPRALGSSGFHFWTPNQLWRSQLGFGSTCAISKRPVRPAGKPMIKVLVVTDVRLWRDGLRHVLGRRPQLRIVGTAATGIEAIAASARLCPDIVLLDMAIPDAADTVQLLGRACPTAGVVGLGVKDAEEDVVRALEAGVRGYVSQDGSIEDLIATIERVTRGEMLCPPRITAALARRVNMLIGAHGAHVGNLSCREKEVTTLVDEGLSNKQIAHRLQITLSTVKNHVHNVLKKLHVRSRREAGHRLSVLRSM